MKLVESFLVAVYVIPDKVQEIVDAVKSMDELKYGDYKYVHWISEEGAEYYNVLESAGKNVSEDEINSNKVVKIVFSIPRSEELLNKLLEKVVEIHPWDEPVIRVSEVRETRAN